MAANTAATKEPSLNTPGVLSARVSSDSSAMAPQPASNPKRGWITTLRDDIDPANSDAPVLTCCFVSGLCDSVAFNASSVFVSMQTGEPTCFLLTHPMFDVLDPIVASVTQLKLTF